jgi:hypothetical protein
MRYIGILSKLHEDHEVAEGLLNQLEATEDGSEEREELFLRAKEEIMVHKMTEERVFYSRLLQHPDTRDIGKHCNEEHSEVDKLVEKLEQMDISSPKWLQTMSKLKKTILHHVQEEESKVFELAQEAFGDELLEQLGEIYEQEKLHVQAKLHGESMEADEVEEVDLEEQSRQALYERAQAENIAGRSHMTKDELVGALRYGSL